MLAWAVCVCVHEHTHTQSLDRADVDLRGTRVRVKKNAKKRREKPV